MKKIFLSLILIATFCLGAAAQNSQRQKVVHMAALRIAEKIQVKASDQDRFVSTYQAYRKEIAAILAAAPAASSGAEQGIENKILNDFDKSGRILDVRRAYYRKFREFLLPSQIQQMYDLEKSAGQK